MAPKNEPEYYYKKISAYLVGPNGEKSHETCVFIKRPRWDDVYNNFPQNTSVESMVLEVGRTMQHSYTVDEQETNALRIFIALKRAGMPNAKEGGYHAIRSGIRSTNAIEDLKNGGICIIIGGKGGRDYAFLHKAGSLEYGNYILEEGMAI